MDTTAMWQPILLVLFAAYIALAEPPKMMSDRMVSLIRKYLLTFDENNAQEEDLDIVRSLKTDHFLSKALMPSNIPGHKEKCWNKCEDGNINMKEKLMGNLPADAWLEVTTQKLAEKRGRISTLRTKNASPLNAKGLMLTSSRAVPKRSQLKPNMSTARTKKKSLHRTKKIVLKQRNTKKKKGRPTRRSGGRKSPVLNVKLRRTKEPMLVSALLLPVGSKSTKGTTKPKVRLLRGNRALIRILSGIK